MVRWSRHCVVAAVTQVRIQVWTDNFFLNRFLEEEAQKQTIKKQPTLLTSRKKTRQKAVPSDARKKLSKFSTKVIKKAAGNIRSQPNHFLASSRSRSSSALWFGHRIVTVKTQVQILVCTDYFQQMRLMEEEADKQTITNRTDASQI